MRVEFELQQPDFSAFTDHVLTRLLARRPGARHWALLGGLACALLVLGGLLALLQGSLAWLSEPVPRALLIALAVALGLLLALSAVLEVLKRSARGRPPTDPTMLGWRVIELAEDGVRETTARGTEVTRWGAIREVDETASQVHLYVTNVSAHVIPKRAFASGADVARFVDIARTRLAGGRPPPSSSGMAWSSPEP
jgi:hypothetical protein